MENIEVGKVSSAETKNTSEVSLENAREFVEKTLNRVKNIENVLDFLSIPEDDMKRDIESINSDIENFKQRLSELDSVGSSEDEKTTLEYILRDLDSVSDRMNKPEVYWKKKWERYM